MLDILILAGLISATALGFKDGFFRKLYGVLNIIGGLAASLFLYRLVGGWFSNWFELSLEISRILAFTVIFTLFIVILNLVYRSIGKHEVKSISVWSRFAGGIIGALQGILIISMFLLFIEQTGMIDESLKMESTLYPSFSELGPKIVHYSMKWLPKSQEFLNELLQKKSH